MKVTIYTSEHCPYCDAVKRYFDKKNIIYDIKNIDLDDFARGELVKKLDGKFRGTPVIDINNILIEGFDRAKIRKATKN